jgi:post-segregation antitoxin (ccd killing protein)
MKNQKTDLATGLSKKCRIVNSVRLSEHHVHLIKAYQINISQLVRDSLDRIHNEHMEAGSK